MRYEAVLATDPNHVQTLNDLAWLYALRADARALSLAERANELLPNNPSVLDTLGWIHVQRDDVARGLAFLQQAAALAPDEPEIRYHHGAALARRGDGAKAREELTAALASGAAFASRDAAERLLAELRAGANR
jgi:tetratricopeptide (TPR) repeat protein